MPGSADLIRGLDWSRRYGNESDTFEVWAVVKVDPTVLDDTLERVHISLPRRVPHRIDALARATGETRSGFITRLRWSHQTTT